MDEKRPEDIRRDLGGWISGACEDPDPDAAGLEALRDEFGDRWTISLTPSRRWEATPRPVAYEVVMASSAAELREKLLQRERRE